MEQVLPFRLSPLFPLLGAGLLLRCVEAAATVWSWPPRASHRASTAFTMAKTFHGRQLLPSLSRMAEGGSETLKEKRSLSGDTPGGRCCLSFPMRTLGLRPCIFIWEGKASQSKIAIWSFQTVQAKHFLKSRTARQSRYRRQGYPKCPDGLAWAGWQGRWHI